MVRPRESFDQHLIDAHLTISPEPCDVRWLQDVFGNSVAIATVDKRAKELVFDSRVQLLHKPAELQNVDIERYARLYPFTYSSEEMPDLLRSIERQHHDPLRQIDSWARRFVRTDGPTDTLAMLSDMTATIRREFTYVPRPEKGTQSPIETLATRKGTCRDYAVLMIEAVRALGFAARFISGYVYNPSAREQRTGGGNTHAWVRVYLPGSGWVEFDPTNGIVGNRGLVRVAVARDIYQAVPISGTWSGFPGSFLDMTVSVDIMLDDADAAGQHSAQTLKQA
jgi:transglutaminase-like putative cysteine protease